MRQAGTQGPLWERLHLDKHLLEQQNTNKSKGTKHNYTHGKAITNSKIQKHHKPTAISELLGSKAGNCV